MDDRKKQKRINTSKIVNGQATEALIDELERVTDTVSELSEAIGNINFEINPPDIAIPPFPDFSELSEAIGNINFEINTPDIDMTDTNTLLRSVLGELQKPKPEEEVTVTLELV